MKRRGSRGNASQGNTGLAVLKEGLGWSDWRFGTVISISGNVLTKAFQLHAAIPSCGWYLVCEMTVADLLVTSSVTRGRLVEYYVRYRI